MLPEQAESEASVAFTQAFTFINIKRTQSREVLPGVLFRYTLDVRKPHVASDNNSQIPPNFWEF